MSIKIYWSSYEFIEKFDNKQLTKIFKKQIGLCLRYKHFHSLIFVSNRTKKNTVFEYLEYLCKNSWLVKRNITRVENSLNRAIVYFKNGSFINVVSATNNKRGNKANNVVIDTDITDQEIVHCIIRPSIAPLFIVRPEWIIKVLKVKPYKKKNFQTSEYVVKI